MKKFFETYKAEFKKLVNKHFGLVTTIVVIEELLLIGFITGII